MMERRDISLKRNLVKLLLELESVVGVVENARDYPFFNASISPSTSELENIEVAILALEDRYYFHHSGAELRAIPRLIKRYIRTRSIGGISTIEQQLVRTVTGRYERNARRKIREILLAYLLQYHCCKKHILYGYLSKAYFGENILGIEAPSMLIFGIESRELNWDQACFVASLLPNPLPRFAINEFSNRKSEFNHPTSIFSHEPFLNTRWLLRVKRRYNYVIDRGTIPKSLLIR